MKLKMQPDEFYQRISEMVRDYLPDDILRAGTVKVIAASYGAGEKKSAMNVLKICGTENKGSVIPSPELPVDVFYDIYSNGDIDINKIAENIALKYRQRWYEDEKISGIKELKMDSDEFMNYLLSEITANLPEELKAAGRVDKLSSRRNNGEEEWYVAFLWNEVGIEKELPIASAVPVGGLYKAYLDGESIISVAEIAVRQLAVSMQEVNPDTMLVSMDFEEIRDRVLFRVISRSHNEELLKDIPYTPIEGVDLMVIYEIINADELIITNTMVEKYGYCVDELYKAAMENTPKVLYPCLTTRRDYIAAAIESMYEERPKNILRQEKTRYMADDGVYVLSNEEYYEGAAALFYPGMLEKLAVFFNENFYVLPKTVEVVYLLPESKKDDRLLKTLHDETKEAMDNPEFRSLLLSDKLYYYDRRKRRLSLAEIL